MTLSIRGRGVLLLLCLFIIAISVGCEKATRPQQDGGQIRIVAFNVENQTVRGTAGPLEKYKSYWDGEWHSNYLVVIWVRDAGYWSLSSEMELPYNVANLDWESYAGINAHSDSICAILVYDKDYVARTDITTAPPYSPSVSVVHGIVDWDVVSVAR